MKLTALSAPILACLLFQPQPAMAQAEILLVRLCKKITDDGARLKCFDAALADPQPQAKAEGEKPAPASWTVTDSKSPIDDSPQVTAILPSSNAKSALMVRCKEKHTEAAIMHDSLFVWETGTVLLRVNDLPPATGRWSAGTNNKSVFAPNGQTFVKMLPDSGTLFVRTTGRSSSEDATFQLGDVSAVRDRISAACRWNATTPPATAEAKPAAASKRPAKPAPAPANEPVSLAPAR